MPKMTKRFKAMAEKCPPEKTTVPLEQAVATLKQFNTTKFDQSVEIAFRLGIDAKQADQLVRGAIVLPHGIGRARGVGGFARGEGAGAGRSGGGSTRRRPTSWSAAQSCCRTASAGRSGWWGSPRGTPPTKPAPPAPMRS